jgi:Flp pilus assembly protein TadB
MERDEGARRTLKPGKVMNNLNYLLAIAAVLVVLWIVATITRFVAGVMLNLLLVVAVILLIVWAVRRFR